MRFSLKETENLRTCTEYPLQVIMRKIIYLKEERFEEMIDHRSLIYIHTT